MFFTQYTTNDDNNNDDDDDNNNNNNNNVVYIRILDYLFISNNSRRTNNCLIV